MLSVDKDISFLKNNKQTPMENLITTFHPRHFLQEYGPSSHYYSRRCVICENSNSTRPSFMYCNACDLCFHKECETSLMENLTIDRPETHEHTLTFIRQKNPFNCVACGCADRDAVSVYLNRKDEMNMYGCLPCNFFIHRDCMYLPKVIKLTRHSHRLSHTFQVPDCNTKCRVCNGPFGCGTGGYICIDKKCDYKLHSYCATKEELWDGRDVEGEPEENEDVTSSLKEVDTKTFRHFSHHHDLMRLGVKGEEEGYERVCQACILRIDFDSYLGCKECDFALHDTCANLPRKLEHMFHRHPLTLEVDIIEEGFFSCSKCKRESCGLMYRCCQEECEFKMDAKCASLADPLYNGAHQHPLTLLASGAYCYKCDLNFFSRRAALPALVKCKYDTHPLSLCFEQWKLWSKPSLSCDACEKVITPDRQDFYLCTDCNTTLHVECAIGKYPYLKPGHTIKLNGFEIEIASNNSLSRLVCHACHSICQDKLVFRNKKNVMISFCSINCIITSS